METRRAAANGIEIAYQTFGNPDDPAVVLVMGLGTQMIAWPDAFCQELAGRGHYVVRFDNRDVGESTHLSHLPVPKLRDLPRRTRAPYTVDDMADDTVGLLDALGLDRVHLVGASLGGFIAQTVALRAPQRLHSLTLIMTSTGSRRVGQARPGLVKQLLRRRAVTSREQAVESVVNTFRLIGSPGFPLDEEHLRDLGGRSWDRGYDRDGYLRQLAAVTAQRNRTRHLRQLGVPTLVIHGLQDPLVKPSGGIALARTIPGARFVGFNGMGHDLPRPLLPDLVDEIEALVARARRLEKTAPASA